ncbi:MAG: hypothetical protein ACK5KT_17130 [Dysgonomonas sp.]
MSELNISYGVSKTQRITNIFMYSYFAIFGLYFCIKEGLANTYSIMFFLSLLCFICGVILILMSTVWLPASLLIIDNDKIEANPQDKKGVIVDWVTISRVNIGPGYVVFLTEGGQKQRKIDLTNLKYEDVSKVKAKIIELCEYKNIPYSND